MTPSLSLHSSTKQEPLLCQWSFFSHFKCTFTICDSSNLEIRLKGVFFISEQSFKQLRECAQSATDSVPGRGDARSMSAAPRSLLILFSAERSCQRRSEHSTSETAEAEERWRERETHGRRMFILVMTREDWAGCVWRSVPQSCSLPHALTEAGIHLQGLKLAFNYEWTECDLEKLLFFQLIQKVIFLMNDVFGERGKVTKG